MCFFFFGGGGWERAGGEQSSLFCLPSFVFFLSRSPTTTMTMHRRMKRAPCREDKKTVSITKPEASPWFEVDLGAESKVALVEVWKAERDCAAVLSALKPRSHLGNQQQPARLSARSVCAAQPPPKMRSRLDHRPR